MRSEGVAPSSRTPLHVAQLQQQATRGADRYAVISYTSASGPACQPQSFCAAARTLLGQADHFLLFPARSSSSFRFAIKTGPPRLLVGTQLAPSPPFLLIPLNPGTVSWEGKPHHTTDPAALRIGAAPATVRVVWVFCAHRPVVTKHGPVFSLFLVRLLEHLSAVVP